MALSGPERTRRLLGELAGAAAPVARLWPVRVRLTAWVTVVSGLAAGVALMRHRADLTVRLHDPAYVLELASLAGLAALLTAQALAAAVPGLGRPRASGLAALGLAAIGVLLLFRRPVDETLTVRDFVATGFPCARTTVLLALGPWLGLLVALRRGAPLQSTRAGALAGGAGFVAALAMMRLLCPNESLLHLAVWHGGPVAAGVGLSTAIGALWLWRWRRGPL